ncbi:cytochrome P450 4C1-like isoform X2 [Camponotus floridanus]|uniref:cytochrome P450 4C1-like isoform X2 n=1 Tax=Camponotus floridanus TaxID=104421 RepID=UPI000DC6892A|nr:cytochrome P450 4C1-like isoform X2 [Camponotus floridanus]
MFITILVSSMFILLVYNYYVYHKKYGQFLNLIPGPSGFPIIGNALQCYVSAEKLWKLFCKLPDEYYPIIKFGFFYIYLVGIRHPDDLETILSSTKHIEKSFLYNVLHPWLNTGLGTSTAIKWRARRKMLTPAFHFNILNKFGDIFIKEGDYMTKSLKDVGGTVVEDLLPFISEHTLNAICETVMGVSLQKFGEVQQKYRNAIHDIHELIIYRGLRPWLYNDLLFSLSPQGRKQKKVLKILHGFTEKIIAERKLYHERTNDRYLKNLESNKEAENFDVFGIKKYKLAMLDLLIAASRENSLTDSDIREEVDTFIFAEHVRAEVDTVMQENGGKLNMKSLQNLSYLDRCLKEALRLYPSASFILRKTGDAVKLQSYIVPAGTILGLNIYGVHRDPNFWPNPDVFDPDRFLPERIKNRHPYSYIPFSAGPRNCIGQRLGLLMMKAIIAPLIHNFYVEPVEYLKNIRLLLDLVIHPAHPVHIRFIPIEYKQPFKNNMDIARV